MSVRTSFQSVLSSSAIPFYSTWMRNVVFLLLYTVLSRVSSIHQWSHQQSLFVPEAIPTYGEMPAMLTGRGFMTLITGYDSVNPGLFIHTTEDGHLHSNGMSVWSLQGKLRVPDVVPADKFGKTMVAYNQTLIVAAPYRSRGLVFVFNGTRSHWSLVQRLQAPDFAENDYFGESMALEGNRLVIASKGQLLKSGFVYVYERAPGSLMWSRQAKLTARDAGDNALLGRGVALFGDYVAATALNDNLGDEIPSTLANPEPDYRTGAGYIFRYQSGVWSQQQKLTAAEFINYHKGGILHEGLDLTLGERVLGPEIALTSEGVILGVTNKGSVRTLRQPVFVFNTTSRGVQQKLTYDGDGLATEDFTFARLKLENQNTLLLSAWSANSSATYIYRSYAGRSWSLQQKIVAWTAQNYTYVTHNDTTNVTTVETHRYQVEDPYTASDLFRPYNNTVPRDAIENELRASLVSPSMWGGYLMHGAGPHGGVQIRSQYRNDSCLVLWMSDHFADGWDSAVLTVRAPDRTNDSFHPHCDQIDPFRVRYCPYQPYDEGIYIIKVFAADQARFFWELSWQVTIEATNETFTGDFSTKMEFNFNATSMSFSMARIQNQVNMSSFCFRCTRIAFQTWSQLQIPGTSAFWPLVVTGAPYYISDYTGRTLAAAGKVCDGVTTYECYQTLTDGIYILRLGGGLFGRITGYPMPDASWKGCGESGGALDQLVFRIGDGKCTPIQKFRYTGRCVVPPVVTNEEYKQSGVIVTPAPTYMGSAKPTQSVFGTGRGSANVHRLHQRDTLGVGDDDSAGDQFPSPYAAFDAEGADAEQAEEGWDLEGEVDHGNGFALLGRLMKKQPSPTSMPSQLDASADDTENGRKA